MSKSTHAQALQIVGRKTLVAIIGMLKAISNGFQSAFMVPTEILAEQHYFIFPRNLNQRGLKGLLTGMLPVVPEEKF